tara:strand:+ start:266 stop:850 length:585 start_codon:yes stop_codon:yes gene_type:complete
MNYFLKKDIFEKKLLIYFILKNYLCDDLIKVIIDQIVPHRNITFFYERICRSIKENQKIKEYYQNSWDVTSIKLWKKITYIQLKTINNNKWCNNSIQKYINNNDLSIMSKKRCFFNLRIPPPLNDMDLNNTIDYPRYLYLLHKINLSYRGSFSKYVKRWISFQIYLILQESKLQTIDIIKNINIVWSKIRKDNL